MWVTGMRRWDNRTAALMGTWINKKIMSFFFFMSVVEESARAYKDSIFNRIIKSSCKLFIYFHAMKEYL